MKSSNKILNILFYMPIFISFSVLLFLWLGEFWLIAIIANPTVIESYHFGSEAMIENGGEKFRTSKSYATSCLILSAFAFIGLIVSAKILQKAKANPALKAYLFSLFSIITIFIIGRFW